MNKIVNYSINNGIIDIEDKFGTEILIYNGDVSELEEFGKEFIRITKGNDLIIANIKRAYSKSELYEIEGPFYNRLGSVEFTEKRFWDKNKEKLEIQNELKDLYVEFFVPDSEIDIAPKEKKAREFAKRATKELYKNNVKISPSFPSSYCITD